MYPPAVMCLSDVLHIKALNFARFCMCTCSKGCYPLSGYLIVAPAATTAATARRVSVFCCECFLALAFVFLLLLLFLIVRSVHALLQFILESVAWLNAQWPVGGLLGYLTGLNGSVC